MPFMWHGKLHLSELTGNPPLMPEAGRLYSGMPGKKFQRVCSFSLGESWVQAAIALQADTGRGERGVAALAGPQADGLAANPNNARPPSHSHPPQPTHPEVSLGLRNVHQFAPSLHSFPDVIFCLSLPHSVSSTETPPSIFHLL